MPTRLQRRVCASYRRGQCDDRRPSTEWHEAADAAIAAVALAEGCPVGKLSVSQVRAVVALSPDLLGAELGSVRERLASLGTP